MKVCSVCGQEIFGKDGENKCGNQGCKTPPKKRRSQKRIIDQAMRDMGLVKVRGALGGTYWE